jgi:hypothetical protein
VTCAAALAPLALLASACSGCSPAFRECAPLPAEQLAALPLRLSETGLFADMQTEAPGDGVMMFAPRFELWSDGAAKRRWIALPPGAQIDTTDPDAWSFPAGTRLWKEFTRDGVRVETRLLFKHGPEPGAWTPLAYVWTDAAEAWATPAGLADAAGTQHDVPSAEQCLGCHGGTRGGVLGFSAIQLPEHGARGAIGLADLAGAGRLTKPVAAVEIPGDELARAALGYLHANCSHCHNQRRPERVGLRCFDPRRSFDFELRTGELAEPASTATYRTALGTVLSPGDPGDSNVIQRVRSRDEWWGMPALGTERVDAAGVQLLEAWIRTL